MNKLPIGALVVAVATLLIGLAGGFSGHTTVVKENGKPVGSVSNFDQVGSGDALQFTKLVQLGSGVQLNSWRNTTGAGVFINPYGTNILMNGGVASSTMTLSIATSSDGITIGGLAPGKGGGYYASSTVAAGILPYATILDQFLIATNTDFAIGTSSMAALSLIRAANDGVDVETEGGWVPVQPLEYVSVLLISTYDQPQVKSCDSTNETLTDQNLCESATSTTRGFNVDVFLDVRATSTINN